MKRMLLRLIARWLSYPECDLCERVDWHEESNKDGSGWRRIEWTGSNGHDITLRCPECSAGDA